MISTRLRAELLMLWTSAGYFPAAASKFLSPRVLDCVRPSTVSAAVCRGNDVGMPVLRWCVCALATGRYFGHTGFAVNGVLVEFHGTVVSTPRLFAPVCVSYMPVMCGLFHVWPNVSPGFCGKSYVRSPTPGPAP